MADINKTILFELDLKTGKITDETKNTVTIDNKKLLKNNITIKIKIKDQTTIVPGTEIQGRPKERITK